MVSSNSSDDRRNYSLPASDTVENLSFDALCSRYRGIMRSVVEARMDAKLMQRLDASDIVQDALLEAFVRFEDLCYRKPMPLANWLRETAIQQLNTALRRHSTTGKRSIHRQISLDQSSIYRLAEQLTAVAATAEDRHALAEDAQRTLDALSGLSTMDREILMLRYIDGISTLERKIL